MQGMVRLIGHTIVAVSYDVVDAQLLDLGVSAGDGAFSARVISTLAGPTGWIDAPRVLLSALGTGAGQHASLTFRSDLMRATGSSPVGGGSGGSRWWVSTPLTRTVQSLSQIVPLPVVEKADR